MLTELRSSASGTKNNFLLRRHYIANTSAISQPLRANLLKAVLQDSCDSLLNLEP